MSSPRFSTGPRVPSAVVVTTVSSRSPDCRFEPFGCGLFRDVDGLAQLHAELLPKSPITKLGMSFMRKFYYAVLPREGLIFGAVAYVDGKPAGFISATSDAEGFMGRGVRCAFPALVHAVVSSALRQPRSALTGIGEALRLIRCRGSGQAIGEILSLGVRAEFRSAEFEQRAGLSIAADLLTLVMGRFRQSAISRARVIIDADNLGAQTFYRKLGWRRSLDSVPGWTIPSIEMTSELGIPAGPQIDAPLPIQGTESP